ncbi:MAG: PQQ-binding-like beta-propeller repeat protein [Planctomycetota bacterium]
MSRLLSVVAMSAAVLSAQQVLVNGRGVLGAIAQDPQATRASADDDPGRNVEMFENPNLDRYLRRAQSFLERDDYTGAIQVLQDVIEGRTMEVVAARAEPGGEGQPAGATPEGAQPAEAPSVAVTNPGPVGTVGAGADSPYNLDARNSVFSHDGRLYRPVSRLCHEMLAKLPEVGIEIYRAGHEVEAQELLDQAKVEGSIGALEQVAARFFVTEAAGEAMVLLADRLMHEGRYRAAVQVLRDLLEVYPQKNRQKLGVRDVWCEFKIALCLRLAGERETAQQAVTTMAERYPEESLRVLGELESVRDLPKSSLFQRDVVAVEVAPTAVASVRVLAPEVEDLIGLWQYRFRDPEPYRGPKPSNRNRGGIWFDGGVQSSAMPFASRYGPATWVEFDVERVDGQAVPRAMFLENFRLREADAVSGLMTRATERSDEPPKAHEGHPRVRIAASDYALLRPVEDEARRYVVVGHENNTAQNNEALKASELVAYDRATWEQVWSSKKYLDGDDGLRDVTFLAAPTVFGERLLLPALRRQSYTLECLDRSSGEPLWHTPIHAGGSEFFKAPGCPVEVQGGIAFVMTNAGCVAAVDAFAGDLRWARRYERRDPVHKVGKARTSDSQREGYVQPFTESELKYFMPSDMIVHDGMVVFAPCDGEVLLALDVSAGVPIWMLDGRTIYAPYGTLKSIVGTDGNCVFALSDTHLVAIELSGGLVRWCRELPTWDGPKFSGRGRGCVVGDSVVVPGVRELLVFDAEDRRPMRRLRLPSFGESREPLEGSYNIVVDGPWIAVGYQGGVEVFSSAPALGEVAAATTDPLRKAEYLTLAGKPSEAETVLIGAVRSTPQQGPRVAAEARLLSLVRSRAMEFATAGDVDAALRAMDGIDELIDERPLRLKWHLARIELCKTAGAMRQHGLEQERLYGYMEGRG